MQLVKDWYLMVVRKVFFVQEQWWLVSPLPAAVLDAGSMRPKVQADVDFWHSRVRQKLGVAVCLVQKIGVDRLQVTKGHRLT